MTIFDADWTSIVNTDMIKDSSWGCAFCWQLTKPLRLGFDCNSATSDAFTSDETSKLSATNDMVTLTEGGHHEGWTSMKETQVLCTHHPLGEGMSSMQDSWMDLGE